MSAPGFAHRTDHQRFFLRKRGRPQMFRGQDVKVELGQTAVQPIFHRTPSGTVCNSHIMGSTSEVGAGEPPALR